MIRRTIVALLLSVPATGFAGGFQRQELSVPGSLLSLVYGDFDGDGLVDLLVAFRRGYGPRSEKFLGVFFRGPEGFGPKPDLTFAAPEDAAFYDAAELLTAPGDELAYLTSIGVYVQSLAGRKIGTLARIITQATVIGAAEEDELVPWDFAKVATDKRPASIVLPTRRALEIYRRDGEAWKRWADPRLENFSYYDAESPTFRRSTRGGSSGRPFAMRVTTVVPNLDLVDQNGDGFLDLVTNYEDRIVVYLGAADGSLADKPSWQRWFQTRTKEEMDTRDSGVSAELVDLDGDGKVDLVLTKIGGGITTLKTKLLMYRGLGSGGFEDQPAQTFEDEGFAALARYEDADGDGTLEMLHPHSEVSIVAMSRAMLQSKLGLEVRVRKRSTEKGQFFVPKPVQVLDTSFGLDLSVGATLRGTAPLFGYDFDGDGRRDVILSEGGEQMRLHRGRPAGEAEMFEEEGNVTLSASGTNTTQILPSHTKKGASGAGPGGFDERFPDVLVYYVARRDLAGKLYVFVNQNRNP